ncbi:MAG: sulfatase-like hydrolase/transferase [Planctomycetota bacterium]
MIRRFVEALVVGLCALPAAAADDARAASDRPNIVVIVADDLPPHMVGFMPDSNGQALTPSLDALAAEGLALNNLHSPSPVCTPSRYALLTGGYASRATNDTFRSRTTEDDGQTVVYFNTKLTPADDNLAKRFKLAGYATGAVGKNHVIEVPGFDNLPYTAKLEDPDVQRRLAKNADAVREAYHAVGFDFAEALYYGNPDSDGIRALASHNQDWITDAACTFIREHADEPFFLYMATTIPHGPINDDRSWNADPRITAEGLLDEPPDVQPARETLPKRVREAGVDGPNRANVLWLDDAVAAVLEQLEQSGVQDNTIIIFVSDHGTSAKGSVYSRGTRTVGMIWQAGGFSATGRMDAAVTLPDLAPTMLDLAGVAFEPAEFDGLSMRPLLDGEAEGLHDALYFELGYTRAIEMNGLRYVAIRYPRHAEEMSLEQRDRLLDRLNARLNQRGRPLITTDPKTPFSHLSLIPGGRDAERIAVRRHPAYYEPDQLYDLNSDPDQQRNLIDDPQYADQLAELRQALSARLSTLPGEFPLDASSASQKSID